MHDRKGELLWPVVWAMMNWGNDHYVELWSASCDCALRMRWSTDALGQLR